MTCRLGVRSGAGRVAAEAGARRLRLASLHGKLIGDKKIEKGSLEMARVKVIGNGRSGKIQYSEGSFFNSKSCEFYWEFSGGDMLATVWFPTEEKWNSAYPWAAGRRKEIMDFVATEVRKQKAKSAKIKWEDDRFHLMEG